MAAGNVHLFTLPSVLPHFTLQDLDAAAHTAVKVAEIKKQADEASPQPNHRRTRARARLYSITPPPLCRPSSHPPWLVFLVFLPRGPPLPSSYTDFSQSFV